MFILDNYIILEDTGLITSIEIDFMNGDVIIINPECLN